MNKFLLPVTAVALLSASCFVIPSEPEPVRVSVAAPLVVKAEPIVASHTAIVSFEREYVTSVKKKEEKKPEKKVEEEKPTPVRSVPDKAEVLIVSDNSVLPRETENQKLTGPKETEIQTLGRTVSEKEQGTEITSIAKKYLGAKYVWGGTSPTDGWDCSGYVQFVFREAGIELPRVEQWVGQQKIKREEALPGDFIVQDGGTHVGIYAGNGMMYSALNPGQGTMLHSVDILPAEFYRITK
ncbi:MAG: C40 family peptidase [Enterococcus sp.]|nr:C40 family peptidase [Enterococcus sp.]